MKKILKSLLITLTIIISIILLDTLQARIFKNSPAISIREFLLDTDSYVDRGIIIDTYYCTKEKDIVTVSWHYKNSKFDCPIDNPDELNEIKGVSMYIKEGTLTNTGATIIIKDMTSKNNIYGDEYRIDKLVDDTWQELDVVVKGNYGWNSIGYHVNENNILELEINWEWLYGKLNKGTYRIVKSTSALREIKHYYFSVQFTID